MIRLCNSLIHGKICTVLGTMIALLPQILRIQHRTPTVCALVTHEVCCLSLCTMTTISSTMFLFRVFISDEKRSL